MLAYDPKHKHRRLLVDATYPGTISTATEGKSQFDENVNQYKVNISATDVDGVTIGITDFITLNDKGTWKLFQLAQALGKEEEFDGGIFDPKKFEGYPVAIVVGQKETKNGTKTNVILEYREFDDKDFP